MPAFHRCDVKLSFRFNPGEHPNTPPSEDDWFVGDDTLDRQGPDSDRPRGHGICKGVASSWVIAFLSGVSEVTNPKKYEKYYNDFLRFQATMIKDFGGNIADHLEALKKMNLPTTLRAKQDDPLEQATFALSDGDADEQWAVYASVWKHDIAFGSVKGSTGPFYIVEPNTGLLGYKKSKDFLADLHDYLAARRKRKGKKKDAPAKFWVYLA